VKNMNKIYVYDPDVDEDNNEKEDWEDEIYND
jgi:hypothetical protein